MPFTVRASKSAFEMIPPVYEQMAMTLGATPGRAFYDTTWKMALRGVLGGLILSWLRCLGEFGATLMVGGAIPGRTENVPIYIYLNMSAGEFDKGVAASVLALLCAFSGVCAGEVCCGLERRLMVNPIFLSVAIGITYLHYKCLRCTLRRFHEMTGL